MAALLYSVTDKEMDQEHSFMRYDSPIVCGHVAYCTDSNNNERFSHAIYSAPILISELEKERLNELKLWRTLMDSV